MEFDVDNYEDIAYLAKVKWRKVKQKLELALLKSAKYVHVATKVYPMVQQKGDSIVWSVDLIELFSEFVDDCDDHLLLVFFDIEIHLLVPVDFEAYLLVLYAFEAYFDYEPNLMMEKVLGLKVYCSALLIITPSSRTIVQATSVPLVPEKQKERGVKIIKPEEPEEVNVMPAVKRTRAQERDEEMKNDTSEEPKKGKKKVKDNKAKSSKKKKSRRPRRKRTSTKLPLSLHGDVLPSMSYLLPKPFIILTLEHNLPYDIQHMSFSFKISKWVLELQEYEYTFIVEDSTRDSLADVLTYKVKEKKITPKVQGKLDPSPQGELEDAYTLLFDGAYRRQRNKAAGGFVILNEEKKEVLKKGIQLHLAHSNNEAKYATLKAGVEECKGMGIKRLMVKGDALLIVRQMQGTWACKNSKLLQWLHEVKLLMKDFEAIQIQHI
ncbi:hypothetical protein L7F22_022079 [Adiantum nelumboides]|nr:hypothetical protein [Adiantum nelumboides]